MAEMQEGLWVMSVSDLESHKGLLKELGGVRWLDPCRQRDHSGGRVGGSRWGQGSGRGKAPGGVQTGSDSFPSLG